MALVLFVAVLILVLAWDLRLERHARVQLGHELRKLHMAHGRLVRVVETLRRRAPPLEAVTLMRESEPVYDLVRPARSWSDDDYETRLSSAPETFPPMRVWDQR